MRVGKKHFFLLRTLKNRLIDTSKKGSVFETIDRS